MATPRNCLFFAGFLVLAFSTVPVRASIVLSIENVTASSGGTASVGVFASSLDGDVLQAYQLPIEFGGNGRGFPAGFSFAPGDFVQEVGTFGTVSVGGTGNLPSPPFVQNYEAIFSDSGPSPYLSLSATPLRLFNLLVDVTAPTGTVTPVQFNASSSIPNQFSVTTGQLGTRTDFGSGVTVLGGSITVGATAVPEPSSMVLLAVAAGGIAYRRKRRLSLAA